MPEKPPSTENQPSLPSQVLNKLNPTFLAIAILTGLLLLAGIIVLAVYRGNKISFWGINIEAAAAKTKETNNSDVDVEPTGEPKPVTPCIPTADLSLVSEKLFDPKATKNQVIANVKTLVAHSEELQGLENNFYFKLLKLELLIPKYGSSIDVKIDAGDKVEAYKRIQSVLKDIGYFNGALSGDQPSTYNALIRFQTDYNKRAGRQGIKPTDFGLLGYRTLEAIRSTYRTTNS